MTSTPVNVQGFSAGALFGTSRTMGTETKGDFGKIFESQKSAAEDVNDVNFADDDLREQAKVKESKPYDEADTAVNKVEDQKESTSVKESSEADAEKPSTDKELEEDGLGEEAAQRGAELLLGAIADVKDLLMQQLQLSEEDLNALMQELNLTDVDLLQLGNVKDLILQAMGAEDMTALLTDEGLYAQMKNLEAEFAQIMQDVKDATGWSKEELNAAVEQLDDALQTSGKDADISLNVEVIDNTDEMQQTKVEHTREKDTNAQQNPAQGNENNPFATQNQVSGQQGNVQSVSSQMTSYAASETESIMRQLMDHMRIQLTPESTELDMQLHPESLGSLQIRISAKEGIMTAQFTTASETVKSVLESQMIQLQQQFDQQNIKVEAIEVTVQTHQFESALEQGKEHQTEDNNNKKSRTRKIDLTRLEETGEVEAEDRILAEMMEANGNSVDYLV